MGEQAGLTVVTWNAQGSTGSTSRRRRRTRRVRPGRRAAPGDPAPAARRAAGGVVDGRRALAVQALAGAGAGRGLGILARHPVAAARTRCSRTGGSSGTGGAGSRCTRRSRRRPDGRASSTCTSAPASTTRADAPGAAAARPRARCDVVAGDLNAEPASRRARRVRRGGLGRRRGAVAARRRRRARRRTGRPGRGPRRRPSGSTTSSSATRPRCSTRRCPTTGSAGPCSATTCRWWRGSRLGRRGGPVGVGRGSWRKWSR